MSNSTSNLDLIVQNQGSQYITANELHNAAYIATTYAIRPSATSGLTLGYYGGNVSLANGSMSQISNGTIILTASGTNYLVASKSTGIVSTAITTTNWNNRDEYLRLYSIVCGTSTITSYTDMRELALISGALSASFSKPVTKTTSFTISDTESSIICNGTATITVTLPNASTYSGREIRIKTVAAYTVISASSDIVSLGATTATTAILPNTVGSWVVLESDGTNWIVTSGSSDTSAQVLSIITETTTAKTLALTDINGWVRTTNASAVTITVPLNSSVAFNIGSALNGIQASAGQVSISGAGGVTINKPTGYNAKTRAQGSTWALVKISTDAWDLFGDLEVTP